MGNNRIMPKGEAAIRSWLNTNHSESDRSLDHALAERIGSEFGTGWSTARKYIQDWRGDRGAPKFHLSSLISIVSGRSVCIDSMSGTVKAIEHLLGQPMLDYEAVFASDEAERKILSQFPELAISKHPEVLSVLDESLKGSSDREARSATVKAWLGWLQAKYGLLPEYTIVPRPNGKD